MKNTVCACVVALICLSPSVRADPKADADYISSQTVTRTMFEGALVS